MTPYTKFVTFVCNIYFCIFYLYNNYIVCVIIIYNYYYIAHSIIIILLVYIYIYLYTKLVNMVSGVININQLLKSI